MQGTLVFQPLLSPQVTIPTVLSSASLAQTPSAYTVSASPYTVQGSDSRIVVSFTPYAVGSTFMPCYQHFSHPAQPIGPATRLSGFVPTCKVSHTLSLIMRLCHLSQSSVSIAPVLLVWQVTSEVTLAYFGAIYPTSGQNYKSESK